MLLYSWGVGGVKPKQSSFSRRLVLINAVFRLYGGRTFFLLRQEESSQRRRRPGVGARYAGSLCYSDFAGVPQEYFFTMLCIAQGAAELGPLGLRQSSPYFRELLRCSAPPTGV